MSSVQEGSSGISRRVQKTERNMRSWTNKVEEILIVSLREVIAQGMKSDNGFRAGYLKRLEHALKKEMPGTNMKAYPHINSKITAWKKSYGSLSYILSRSGVGFNAKGNYMIECEDDTWEQILEVDFNAKLVRYKSWPLNEVWKELFGNDRATGDAAEDLLEACNDVMNEDYSGHGDADADYDIGSEDIPDAEADTTSMSQSRNPAHVPVARQKKCKLFGDIQEVCKVLDRIGRNTNARLANLAVRIGYEFDLAKHKKEAFEKLENMNFLTLAQRFVVCELLSKEVDKLEVFRGLSEIMVPYYVEHILKNVGQ